MRKVKRWRYYCDYCKKSGGSGGHMAKHEKRCTMNPNRICGMCKLFDFDQPDLKELIALLPDPEKYCVEMEEWNNYPGLDKAVEEAMPGLREKAQDCPACILAALRQAGIFVRSVESFDFTKECREWWSEFNEEQMR